jgi:iron complex outermembrane receptor protein
VAGGYRQHESNYRNLLLAHAKFNNKEESSYFTFTALGFQGKWELPGALNAAEAEADPQAALPYSVAMDAHVRKSSLLLAAKHGKLINDRWSMQQLAYFTLGDKNNPYGTSAFNQGYKQERTPGAGFRTYVLYYHQILYTYFLSFRAGGEMQWEGNRYLESVNDSGAIGAPKWDMRQHSTQGFAFAHVALNAAMRWGVSAEASINTAGYRLTDNPVGAGSPNLTGNIGFGPQWQHSFGGQYAFLKSEALALKARVSRGFSQPSLWEVFLPSGELLKGLSPETHLQGEVGLSSVLKRRQIRQSLNVYRARLENMIVPQTDTAGVTRYFNAGQTRQQGLEYVFAWDKSNQKRLWFVQLATGLQDYRYVRHGGNDAYDGNQIPGVASFTASALMEFGKNGETLPWSLRANARYQSPVQLNDANSASADPFLLLGISGSLMYKRGGWRFPFWIEGGVSNLLDQRWNSFLNLNAANARFFNPGPGRSFWLGLRFQHRSQYPFAEPINY